MRARRDPTIAAEDELLYVAIIAPMPSPTILAPAETAPATPDGMGWSARSGRTLHALLTEWSARAGWTLIWRSAYDYPLEASANFPGDFAQAATMLVSGFAEASPPPRAKLFRDNRVLVIE